MTEVADVLGLDDIPDDPTIPTPEAPPVEGDKGAKTDAELTQDAPKPNETSDEQWNKPEEVPEQQKTQDELILERLNALIHDPETATKYTKALFYGDMGTSKTVAACNTGGKVLLVAIERGQKSLRNHPDIMKNVKIMQFKSVNQIEMLAMMLQRGEFAEYETIVLDTFSELQKKDLDDRIDDEYRADPSRNRYTPIGKDYQTSTEHMRRIAAAFRDVDRNVIFTCHEKQDKDDETGRIIWRADLTDKVAKTLGSYVDIVMRFTAEAGEDGNPIFKGQCRPTRNVIAKTRIGLVPTFTQFPTFKMIHDADLKTQTQMQEN